MNLILINPQSNQQILLDKEDPLIIGRNNVAGCFDKKVSRTHGRITCTENGKVNLVALHRNPCFFMKNGVPPIRQLNKDEEETLNEGDCLGLLPNSYWFQISSKKEVNSESGRDSETTNLENVKENRTNTTETQNAGFSRTESSDYSKRIGSPEFEKTRRLPLSMYETDEIEVSDKSSDARYSDKKIRKLRPDDCVNPKLDMKYNESAKEEPSTSKNFADKILANDNKTEEKTVTQEDNVAGTNPDRSTKRFICRYEHNCFRKNPQHKIKFCHPGDSDYVAYEKRPFCQNGEACCRRNKTHWVKFRHASARPPSSTLDSSSPRPFSSLASSPLPFKRRRKQVKRNSDYEDEDDQELFINDASSDEYVPSDLNSEEDLDEPQES